MYIRWRRGHHPDVKSRASEENENSDAVRWRRQTERADAKSRASDAMRKATPCVGVVDNPRERTRSLRMRRHEQREPLARDGEAPPREPDELIVRRQHEDAVELRPRFEEARPRERASERARRARAAPFAVASRRRRRRRQGAGNDSDGEPTSGEDAHVGARERWRDGGGGGQGMASLVRRSIGSATSRHGGFSSGSQHHATAATRSCMRRLLRGAVASSDTGSTSAARYRRDETSWTDCSQM